LENLQYFFFRFQNKKHKQNINPTPFSSRLELNLKNINNPMMIARHNIAAIIIIINAIVDNPGSSEAVA
jgi:hypothetical protein